MEEEKKQEIIFRSEAVQDILSAPLTMLVRIGSSVIGIVLFTVLTGCFIFKYPDTINCEVTITKNNPPVVIVAKATGRLQELYVNDGETVKKDDIIAVIENPARTEDVLILDSLLTRLVIQTVKPVNMHQERLMLGSIQGSYATLIKAVTDFNNFVWNNLYDRQIKAEEARLKANAVYVSAIEQQAKIVRQLHELSDNNYQREKILYDKGLTSTADMENVEQILLNSEIKSEQIRASIANSKIQMAQIRNNIAELQLQKEREQRQIETALFSALENLRNDIQEWRQAYVLQSPTDGVVSYSNLWQVNQHVTAGDNTFSVVDTQRCSIIGKAKVPIVGAGKVKVGQRVNIKLHSFPYLEYGFLTAYVSGMSFMPDENFYIATLEVESDLQTSYGKNIPYVADLMGEAEIVTENLSVAERMIGPIRYLWKRNISKINHGVKRYK